MHPGDYRVEPVAVNRLHPHTDSVRWTDRSATTVLAVTRALTPGQLHQPTYQVVTVAGSALVPPKIDGTPGELDLVVPADVAQLRHS